MKEQLKMEEVIPLLSFSFASTSPFGGSKHNKENVNWYLHTTMETLPEHLLEIWNRKIDAKLSLSGSYYFAVSSSLISPVALC